MSAKFEFRDITQIYYEDKPVTSVYYGDQLAWSAPVDQVNFNGIEDDPNNTSDNSGENN